MIGVILSGGQSVRMGKDKGLLQYRQQTWVQQAFNKLSSLQIPVIVSVNTQQLSSYQSIFPTHLLVTDNPALSIGGPLRGILTIHLLYPDEDLFILACDMINMQPDLLTYIFKEYQDNPTDALVLIKDKHPEPLCSIYSAKALSRIYTLFTNQELHKHSMKYALDQLKPSYLPVAEKWTGYFNNYNTLSDLKDIQL
ncbi:molybdenum cofactor guanylyltransferase [Pedobacter cryoconitis]|uniref:Molybdopterin-guanine dinucleotide biosynthesis protein A n=1 Tax=Pedobacter cryoconitis TaxID=188932 RepID=A0A7X0J8R5_9SPHI|nr:molybdenum cofactor guanylyltransferase [Pedobacter cryoconitis]MBB6501791.1 molybdopterin-guanine dinucleotide biosynthesis protein A [Pedobacter cryoconitis]